MDRGKSNVLVLGAPAAEPALEFERITPGLALVCPELAEAARSRLPEIDPDLPWLVGSRPRVVVEDPVLVPKTRPWLRIPMRSRTMVAIGAASVGLLATGALTAAEIKQETDPRPVPVLESSLPSLVVPDLIGRPYVFAKQVLDDSGFAWEVEGPIEGYAGNVVSSQVPLPGTEVVGIELPRVTLTLDRNADYEERGVPQNVSRDPGTPVYSLDPVPEQSSSSAGVDAGNGEADTTEAGPPEVEADDEGAADQEAVEPGVNGAGNQAGSAAEPEASPAGEESALERALFLASWVLEHPNPTDKAVSYWLWQHSEIIDGARGGETDAAEALEILIEIDRDLQKTWGVGAKSEALARETLEEIQSRQGSS